MHEAAISGHLPMLTGLVNKFATPEYRAYRDQINAKNNFGDTPLHLAVQFDHPDIVKFLVRNHADLAIMNHHKVTASQLGVKLGREDSLDILNQAEYTSKTAGGAVERTPAGAADARLSLV